MTSTQQVSKKSVIELEAAKNEKNVKCNALKKNIANIVTKNMHSPIFIVYAAFLSIYTVIAAIGAVTSISDNLVMSLISLLLTVPAIISAICAWKLYASKETVTADKMKGLRSFIVYSQVISILLMIVVCILAVILVVGGNFLADIVEDLGDSLGGLSDFLASLGEGGEEIGSIGSGASDAINAGATTFRVIIFVVAALLVFIFGNVVSTFSKDKKHFKFIENAVTSGNYNVSVKVPKVRSFIYGCIIAILGCLMFTASVFTALQTICLGGYVFVTAIIFMDIHKSACQNQKEIDAVEAEILELDREIIEAKKEKAEAEEAELRKAKNEREKQEAQQQMMMQMMMAQMMKNNGVDPNAQQTDAGNEQKSDK